MLTYLHTITVFIIFVVGILTNSIRSPIRFEFNFENYHFHCTHMKTNHVMQFISTSKNMSICASAGGWETEKLYNVSRLYRIFLTELWDRCTQLWLLWWATGSAQMLPYFNPITNNKTKWNVLTIFQQVPRFYRQVIAVSCRSENLVLVERLCLHKIGS